MKAIAYTQYGNADVLRLVDAPRPVPGPDQVLVKVRAASVNALDWRLMLGKPWITRLITGGWRTPNRRPGVDLAGVVDAVGSAVTAFEPGDAVFGVGRGAFAEYACTTPDRLARKPPNVSFEDAAAVGVAAITALQAVRDRGRIRPGQAVLVDGASGGVGTFAVQLAKAFGGEVTAVCRTHNIDNAHAMGADHVIDYTRQDFTRTGRRYDLVVAANAHRSIFDYRRVLAGNGTYVQAGGAGPQILQGLLLAPLLSVMGPRKFRVLMARMNQPDLQLLGDLLAAGRIAPVIDRRYALAETAEAVRYVSRGHARGKVAITVG